MRVGRLGRALASIALATGVAGVGEARAEAPEPFPSSRPANRLQALAALGGGVHAPESCLSLRIQAAASDAGGAAGRRALAILRRDSPLPSERQRVDRGGNVIRYSLDRGSLDRLDSASGADGVPSAVLAVQQAMEDARSLLVGSLDLPDPGPLDVLLVHLGPGARGAFLPAETDDRGGTIWVDGSGAVGLPELRADVAHQYAHAVAARISLDPAWSEALAGWVTIELEGTDTRPVDSAVSARFARLEEGIPTEDERVALGNAAWLAWLHEARGATAVRTALLEIAASRDFVRGMERTLRRVDGSGFRAALRDFHLWSVLVGAWADGRHFPFAPRLDDPDFADVFDGLPALSIQAASPLAAGGVAHALVRPGLTEGGVVVRFEGEFGGSWECDLLLRGEAGELHRLALPLDADGRGQVRVPSQAARDIVILVRNVEGSGVGLRRYTWTAFRDPGYPVRFAGLSAAAIAEPAGAVSIRWETASEQGLVGFHLLRAAADGGEFRKVHPVWVPAVGTAAEGALYEFIDLEATAGVNHLYRVEAVTEGGLTARSATVSATPVAPTD